MTRLAKRLKENGFSIYSLFKNNRSKYRWVNGEVSITTEKKNLLKKELGELIDDEDFKQEINIKWRAI